MAEKDDSSEIEEQAKTPIISFTKEKVDLRKKEQPLVDMKVTNPVTYLKRWWDRIIGNEGVDFRFRVRPLTAIAITLVVVAVAYGVGRIKLPFKIPFFEYALTPSPSPEISPTPNPWRPTAFTGVLHRSANKFYLLTSASEAITLEVPEEVVLEELIGKRILATGEYNSENRTLKVSNVDDLEILASSPSPIPTNSPSPTPTLTPTASPSATPSE